MKKTYLLGLLALVLLFGCKPIHNTQYVDRWHDSVVRITVRDTLIKYLPQKQSVIAVKYSFLTTDLAFSYASIDSLGLLHHSIENKGFIPSKVITKDTKVRDIKQLVKTTYKTETVYKTVNRTKWLGWVDYILLALAVAYGILKWRKII
jgi:hypothetical protein